jgi:4-oxalomesaconate tautomerase
VQTRIPFIQMRGGGSKGLYLHASDLPDDDSLRNAALVAAMGEGARQIDGLGGADPLTSKVAIISPSSHDDADVDYLFVQVVVGKDTVDTTQICGNILAGVAPFAIEQGVVDAVEGTTSVRIHMLNSGSLCEVDVSTPGGEVSYEGDVRIDGVPGTAAPVLCNYLDVAGSATGSLLPTGKILDQVNGVDVSCIDNGMPVVVMRAADMGITGYESRDELNANDDLKTQLEAIRLELGPLMNLGDVSAKVVPKMSMIAPPVAGGHVCSRTFIPHVCHASIGVLGAVSVATACLIPDSVAEGIAAVPDGRVKNMSVEHPSGEFSVQLTVDGSEDLPEITRVGLLRTARKLAEGTLYVPASIWNGE